MKKMTNEEKIAFYERQMRNNKKGSDAYMRALIELRNIPNSGYSVPSNTEDQPMENDPSEVKPEKSSTMMDGGMARGKGNKMYQHNYATGGKVVDNLSMASGGMANTSMAGGGPTALKNIPSSNEGLKKLPTHVRNRMGYMKKGGMAKGRGSK